jgi:hypothetical protein
MRHHTNGNAGNSINFPRMAVNPHKTTQKWIWIKGRVGEDMEELLSKH